MNAFAPFSLGTRGCPGKIFAGMELNILLARLFYAYDFRSMQGNATGEGHPEMGWGRQNTGQFQFKDAFAPLRDGPYVQFKRRSTETSRGGS